MGVHLGAVGAANWSSQFSGEYGVTVAVTGKTKRASKTITPAPLPARTWHEENERLTTWGQQFAVRIMRMSLRSEERTYAVGAKLSKRHSNLASAHHVSWRRLSEKGRCEIWAFLQARSPPILAERVRTGWANMIPNRKVRIIMNEGTLLIIIIRRYSLYEGTYYIRTKQGIYTFVPSYVRTYVPLYLLLLINLLHSYERRYDNIYLLRSSDI